LAHQKKDKKSSGIISRIFTFLGNDRIKDEVISGQSDEVLAQVVTTRSERFVLAHPANPFQNPKESDH
jgi:hypothetical protein